MDSNATKFLNGNLFAARVDPVGLGLSILVYTTSLTYGGGTRILKKYYILTYIVLKIVFKNCQKLKISFYVSVAVYRSGRFFDQKLPGGGGGAIWGHHHLLNGEIFQLVC